MRLEFLHRKTATDEVIYQNSQDVLNFRIGDVRDYPALLAAMRETDVVFHAAALKQVPSCEYFPFEAVQTNIYGAQNVVRAIRENNLPVEKVVGISTDKACKPINVMGMTKALQERVLIEANRDCPNTRFMCVRYGNVIASRGSIVPLFVEQVRKNQPITITLEEMTRFLLSLNKAVDTVFAAISDGRRGETFVPKVAAAKITDLAKALMGDKDLPIVFTGIRPGEKVHEIMVSEEECFRTVERGDYYAILPVLPELREEKDFTPALAGEYSSKDKNITVSQLRELLANASSEIAAFL
jgi:UDP-glucose 4-epimerase